MRGGRQAEQFIELSFIFNKNSFIKKKQFLHQKKIPSSKKTIPLSSKTVPLSSKKNSFIIKNNSFIQKNNITYLIRPPPPVQINSRLKVRANNIFILCFILTHHTYAGVKNWFLTAKNFKNNIFLKRN